MQRLPTGKVVLYVPEEWRLVDHYYTYSAEVHLLESPRGSRHVLMRCADNGTWWAREIRGCTRMGNPAVDRVEEYNIPDEERLYMRDMWDTLCSYSTEPLV